MTDQELRALMQALVRMGPVKYAEMYWIAYLARFGHVSLYAPPNARARSMSQDEAMAECEAFVKARE